MARLVGNVKWFDAKKGFGFIIGPEQKDVFVHFSSIEGDGFRALKDGEEVEYELTTGDKGLHAKAVRRTKQPEGLESSPRRRQLV
jgi:cold shock protein